MDVADSGIRPPEAGIEPGVVKPVAVHLIETQRHIEWRSARLLVLPAQIVEQLVRRDREVAYSAFDEIPGERGLRPHQQIGRFRPAPDLPEQGAEPAEVFLIRPFVRTYLGNGETEHGLKVRGEKWEVRGVLLALTPHLTSHLSPLTFPARF
jgi:hypothetical protein